jgi:undecaprenyl-diphosphatase
LCRTTSAAVVKHSPIAVAGVSLAVFLLIWCAVAARTPPVPWLDHRVDDWSIAERRHGGALMLAHGWSRVGAHRWLPAVALLGAASAALRRYFVLAVAVLLAGLSTLVVRGWLAHLIGRPRPVGPFTYAGDPSFPSGHATESMASAVILVVLAARLLPRRWPVVAIGLIAALWTLSMGVSRLIVGAHWLSDVLAGWAFGLGWPLLAIDLALLASAAANRRSFRATG